ncbi:hypothetical protein BT63DRAFT_450022 [Microthyrium microscopicum]|uniref:Uncharacterized protein n=1 Tax=Microthyrium microscopicum TaxID=703497 RepID=A0A6A6UTE0_9PEZI|nr:hypothetical protein BT63DRAFT_450022 [Microthyrium microscopicum]
MRNKGAAQGKVYKFKSKSEWSDKNAQLIQLSTRYRSHMVVVLGKAFGRPPGWVRIVNVTSTLPEAYDPTRYLPIHPNRKFRKGGIQLKLCGSWEQDTLLPKFSYIRIDNVQEVPLEILMETTRWDGLGVMLQEKSFSTLLSVTNAAVEMERRRKSGMLT